MTKLNLHAHHRTRVDGLERVPAVKRILERALVGLIERDFLARRESGRILSGDTFFRQSICPLVR